MNSTCFEVSNLLLLLFFKQVYYEDNFNLPPPTLKKQMSLKTTLIMSPFYFSILNVHASMFVIQMGLATFSQKGL